MIEATSYCIYKNHKIKSLVIPYLHLTFSIVDAVKVRRQKLN
jgi:hypothetical protein